MNFSPPRRWLQPSIRSDGSGYVKAGPGQPYVETGPGQRAQGLVAPEAAPQAAWTRPAPGAFAERRLAGRLVGAGRRAVMCRYEVVSFTAEAMALAALRYDDDGRSGQLLPLQQSAADCLDAYDPVATHLVARVDGQLVAALRLLLPDAVARGAARQRPPDADPLAHGLGSWQDIVSGPHAMRLAARGATLECSRLTAAPRWRRPDVLAPLLAKAYQLGHAAGCCYVVALATKENLTLWRRLGLWPTGLGGYVPSLRPYVVEVLSADLAALLAGQRPLPSRWFALFGERPAPNALYAAAQRTHAWRRLLQRWLPRWR